MAGFPEIQGYWIDPAGIHYLQIMDSTFVEVMGPC